MSQAINPRGYLSQRELQGTPGYPSKERLARGPVVAIECIDEIPCNPCEQACPQHAITIGKPITKRPCLDEDKCIGCGVCVPHCPGQAIFLINMAYSPEDASVAFPYEYLPLPEKGQTVRAVNREGEPVCSGTVIRVQNPKMNKQTPVVTVAVPREYAAEVRGIFHLRR